MGAIGVAPSVAPGYYLTDGKRLVCVLRIEDTGNAMVQDAKTDALFYIEPADHADWRVVSRGA